MSTPIVAFRADASLDIGTGHVMRCLTLADALRERGARSRFVCRAHPGHLLESIRQCGHEALALPAEEAAHSAVDGATEADLAHAAWLGTDWATDARQTLQALGGPVDWLVADHYALDARWEKQLRPACRRLMAIDDLADRPHDVDLLLDQNLGRAAADYAALVPAHCRVLAGPQHALLRPEFAALRAYSLQRRATSRLHHLLVTMGGVDKDNATGLVLQALHGAALPAACRITVVMGPHAPWLAQVRKQAAALPWATEVLVNVRDMARLMADCDLAIGAAGGTAWERCCLGLPTLTLVTAANQRAGAAALEAARAAAVVHADQDLPIVVPAYLSRLAQPQALLSMQSACAAITDGEAVSRLATLLMDRND